MKVFHISWILPTCYWFLCFMQPHAPREVFILCLLFGVEIEMRLSGSLPLVI